MDLAFWSKDLVDIYSSLLSSVAPVYLSLLNLLPKLNSGLFKTGNLVNPKHYVSERTD